MPKKEPAKIKMPKVISVGGVPFEEYAKKKFPQGKAKKKH